MSDPIDIKKYARDFEALILKVQGLMDYVNGLESEKKREDEIKYRKLRSQNRLKILDADAEICRNKVKILSREKRILDAKSRVFEKLSGGLSIVVDIENWLKDKDSEVESHIRQGEKLKKELDDIFVKLHNNMKEEYKEEAGNLLRWSGVNDIYEDLKTELEERENEDVMLLDDALQHTTINDPGNFMALRF